MSIPSKRKPPLRTRKPQVTESRGTRILPVVEEEVVVSRVSERTGRKLRVRIESREETQRVPVSETIEEVSVERIPINRYVEERSGCREEGDVIIIPVYESVSVVEQRLLLKEEVRIVRRRRQIQREEEVVLRKETPIIEHKDSERDEWSRDPQDS